MFWGKKIGSEPLRNGLSEHYQANEKWGNLLVLCNEIQFINENRENVNGNFPQELISWCYKFRLY